MKERGLINVIYALCLVSGSAFAAEVKLNSNDGSSKFIVQDLDAAAVLSVDSDGNTVIGGTAAVAGSGFSVGGSTLVVKAGKVGIGTAAPVVALDVNGGVRVGNYVSASTPSPAARAKSVRGAARRRAKIQPSGATMAKEMANHSISRFCQLLGKVSGWVRTVTQRSGAMR